jgi:hypothetical protein
MDDVYGAVEVFDSIDVWKMIKPKSPPQIWENNS